ncbi:MAG TPA: ImmA/IrrE family metallo-endopeptidase [Bryobacteraceae bacterium]|nr:ImmA/IrrE family metallo-endopeptidase [Bryobacteraceae bacterium]
MPDVSDFHPNWISTPGDTINDLLRERGITLAEFADRMGLTLDGVTELVQGRSTITIRVARRLEEVLGASVEFWMSRDFQYREDVVRLRVPDEGWLRELPIGDMIKFGWIKPVPSPADEVDACLRFFDVRSISAWREAYADVLSMAVFRTSPSFDSRPASVATWLRQGEVEAAAINCERWDACGFETALSAIRPLTREKSPDRFIPRLREACAASGVAVVVVRAPNGCRASGAARFLSTDKALIQLSFRYLSDDQFWFTFFHEAGHLLLHGNRKIFVDGLEGVVERAENEANQFAVTVLIPPEFHTSLLRLRANQSREVIRFAQRLGISPGIVVGQLQHHGKVRRDRLNRLKRRFQWSD